jgi:hypothetical protein
VVNGTKEGSDVEIEHPAHALRHHGLFQSRQGRMWAASRSEAVAEAQEVGLVDGTLHLGHRTLDNLILERGKPRGRELIRRIWRPTCARQHSLLHG